jgi:preprotein translocase subunit SecE
MYTKDVNVKTVEAKKTESLPGSKMQEATLTANNIVNFFAEVKQELKKISWTTPEELRVYTKVVVATTFLMGLSIYMLDLVIQSFLNGLSIIFRWLG